MKLTLVFSDPQEQRKAPEHALPGVLWTYYLDTLNSPNRTASHKDKANAPNPSASGRSEGIDGDYRP